MEKQIAPKQYRIIIISLMARSRETVATNALTHKDSVGDITVGDYWGVQKYDPQLLVEQRNDQ